MEEDRFQQVVQARTRQRVELLNSLFVQESLGEGVEVEEAMGIWEYCARFQDRPTRLAVLEGMNKLLKKEGNDKALSTWLLRKKVKGLGQAELYQLLRWCALVVAKQQKVVDLLAQLVNELLTTASNGRIKMHTIRIAKGILKNDQGLKLLEVLCDVETVDNLALLGIWSSCSVPSPEMKEKLLRIYKEVVIGSRIPLSSCILKTWQGFLMNNFKEAELKQLLPSLERMLLRAPEALLGAFENLLLALQANNVDLTTAQSLILPLQDLSLRNNTKANEVLRLLLKGIKDKDSVWKLLIGPLDKGGLTWEQRVGYYQTLKRCLNGVGEVRDEWFVKLNTCLGKEKQDLALAALIEAWTCSAVGLKTLPKEVYQTIQQGIKKNTGDKRGWWMESLALLVNSDQLNKELAKEEMKKSWLNDLLALIKSFNLNTYSLAEGYQAALSAMKLSNDTELAALVKTLIQTTAPKPSFLINEKIYVKCTTRKELTWLRRAIEFLLPLCVESSTIEEKRVLGELLIYMASQIDDVEFRLETQKLFCTELKVTPFLQVGFESWLRNAELGKKTLKSPSQFITRACYHDPDLVLPLALEAHHPLITTNPSIFWITLAQLPSPTEKSFKLQKVGEYVQVMKKRIQSNLEQNTLQGFHEAAILLIKTLCWVEASFISVFKRYAQTLLNLPELEKLDAVDLAIWKTAPGKLYTELKKEKNATPKIIKQQTEAQLAKEQAQRDKVQGLVERLNWGLEVIEAMIPMLEGEQVLQVSEWLTNTANLNPAILNEITASPVFIFLQLERVLPHDWNLGLRHGIIKCLWRLHHTLKGDDEQLGSLVIRILYRWRFAVERSRPDAWLLTLFFPLLEKIIKEDGIYESAKERAAAAAAEIPEEEGEQPTYTEQTLIALEIVALHCDITTGAPVSAILKLLFLTISTYPKMLAPARRALFTLVANADLNKEDMMTLSQGLLHSNEQVRVCSISAMDYLDVVEPNAYLFVTKFSPIPEVREIAERLWQETQGDASSYEPQLVEWLDSTPVKLQVSEALAEYTSLKAESFPSILRQLKELYEKRAKLLLPEYDQYGLVIPETLNRPDPWEVRESIAIYLVHAPKIKGEEERVFEFILKSGALGDRHESVRRAFLKAGLAWITSSPKLVEMVETELGSKNLSDWAREATVVLYGSMASKSSGHINQKRVVQQLLEALKTPSESVQIAVAECLAPLIKDSKGDDQWIDDLVDRLEDPKKSYAERKGCSYGLAGLVKGRGLTSLPPLLERLGNGAVVLLVGALSTLIGRLLEPFLPRLLPLLLSTFADPKAEVREATQEASRTLMQSLSSYGVKLTLPLILSSLKNESGGGSSWRSKQATVQLLGAMAYCAPRQLSVSLPLLMPRLTEVLWTDSHERVQKAALESLGHFGRVITNPEIKSMLGAIMKALADPTRFVGGALNSLLQTEFVHYVDAPSLALLVPLVARGFSERGVKRQAAQLVGRLVVISSPSDFIPYIESLVPLVKSLLGDPVPESRATAAKSLGILVQRLGKESFPHLLDELLGVLKGEESGGVDRQGTAQALAQVLAAGLGDISLVLPLLLNVHQNRPLIREGFLSLLVYLPATFGTLFEPYLPECIPALFRGLGDEASEQSRETCLQAGRIFILNYPTSCLTYLLPEILTSLLDHKWRLRHSSILLLSNLIGEEAAESGVENVELDEEQRFKVLAVLFLIKDDSTPAVRQSAVQLWRGLLKNAPPSRIVQLVLPNIVTILLTCYADISADEDEEAVEFKKTIVIRALQELTSRFGLMEKLVPLLVAQKGDASCYATQQLVLLTIPSATSNTPPELDNYEWVSMHAYPLLRDLVTSSAAANRTVSTLLTRFPDCLLQIWRPHLIFYLSGSSPGDEMLEQLQGLASTLQPKLILPFILELCPAPLKSENLSLLTIIWDAVLSSAEDSNDVKPWFTQLFELLLSTSSADPEWSKFMESLLSSLLLPSPALSSSSGSDASSDDGSVDYSDYSEDEDDGGDVIADYNDGEEEKDEDLALELHQILVSRGDGYQLDKVLTYWWESEQKPVSFQVISHWLSFAIARLENWDLLTVLLKTLPKPSYELYVPVLVAKLESSSVKEVVKSGYSLLLSVFTFTMLNSKDSEAKQASALGLFFLIRLLAPSCFTKDRQLVPLLLGPLIRILGEKSTGSELRRVCLGALQVLFAQAPPLLLKAFLPQLQRTFLNALKDPSTKVRVLGSNLLGVLAKSATRLDPLVTELCSGILSSSPESGELENWIAALVAVLSASPSVTVAEDWLKQAWSLFLESGGSAKETATWYSLFSHPSLKKQVKVLAQESSSNDLVKKLLVQLGKDDNDE